MLISKTFAFLLLLAYVRAKCDLSPRFWCTSQAIAEECGAIDACNHWWKMQSASSPVAISLYFESLCPGCREFITTMFYPTWKTFKSTGIMKADMTPYGNAHQEELPSGMWNFTCQHGPEECTGNLIENCLQKYTDYEFDVYFPIIYCMEDSSDPIAAAEKCITDAKQDWNAINKCAKGEEGNGLMHKSGMKTDALEPKHTYVPWILVNGKHSEELQQKAQNDLPKLLCEMYSGEKPKECQMFMHSYPTAAKQKFCKYE